MTPGYPCTRRAAWLGGVALYACLGYGGAQGEDLADVYRIARVNDPTYLGQRYALDSVREKVHEAFSAVLPTIGATSSIGRAGGFVAYSGVPAVSRPFNTNVWTVQLTMPVVRAPGLVAYRQSEAAADEASAEFSQAEQDLLIRVAKGYFDVVAGEEGLSAAIAHVRAAQEQVTAAQRGYERGVGSITDRHEASARAELAESQRVAAETDLETKRAELEKIVGALESPLAALGAESIMPVLEPDDLGAWEAQARGNNPAVQAAMAASRVAQLEVKRASAQRLPTLDLVASYGRNYSSGNNTNPIDYGTNAEIKQIGLQFSMPIVDFGGLHAQVAEARAKSRQADAQVEVAQRQSVADAREAYHALKNGAAQIRALQSGVSAATESLKGNQAGFRAGLRINSEVLTAEEQVYISRRDLARARYDTLLQGLKLKAAAGILRPADLNIINGLLQVSARD